MAVALHGAGYRVFAGMRDPDRRNKEQAAALRAAAPIDVVALDVTCAESVRDAVQTITREAGGVSVLVNNAGRMSSGVTEAFAIEQARADYEVNFFGALRLTLGCLPGMRPQRGGAVVFVSSVAASVPFPFHAHYNGSKLALEALAETLRLELSAFSIDSLILQPGPFPSGLSAAGPIPTLHDIEAQYGDAAKIPARLRQWTATFNDGPWAQDARLAGEALVALLARPYGTRPHRTIVGAIDYGAPAVNMAREQAQAALLAAWGLNRLAPRTEQN
jgi:NAD(P)-dependent dehydrogenase (short-subunit alcohol dehydrogenase family)